MALAYGTAARLPTSNGVTTANPATFNFTCPANTGVLWLRIFVAGTTARAGGAPTYNGVPMTAGHAKTNHGGTAEACGETWYMLNPPTGSAYTISVPNTGGRSMALIAASATKSGAGMSCARENGVNTPGNSTNPSATTPALSNTCLVFAGVGDGATTWAPSGRTGTQIYDWDAGSYGLGAQYRSGSGALQMGWTFGTSEDWLVQADAFYEFLATIDLSAVGAIASGEAHGTPILSLQLSAAGAIASLEAFGTPIVSTPPAPHEITAAGGIASAEALGSPNLAVALSPQAIASTEACGVPALSASVSPPAIPSAEIIGTPALGAVLTAWGIVSDELLGVPALGALLAAAGISSQEAFGEPTVSTGPVDINLSGVGGIASLEAVGVPALVPQIAASGMPSVEAFGGPAVGLGLHPVGIASAEAMGIPTVNPASGDIELVLSGIASAEAFGTPSLCSRPRCCMKSSSTGSQFL